MIAYINTRSHLTVLGLFLAVLLFPLATPASAQCFGPDMLDVGNCCQPVNANLPPFPQVALPGLGICWDNCNPALQNDIRVDWAPPALMACGQYSTTMSVVDSSTGALLMTGLMVLDYTRTWYEVEPVTGGLTQVWRFVAKVDLTPSSTPGFIPPCPVPSCLPPLGVHKTAFFYGYVDYAQVCGTVAFEQSIVLYHGCDFLIHKPGLSSRPGTFHPTLSYGIVAPHSAVQPFVPANLPAPGGPLVAEATRNVSSPFFPASLCQVEDRVVSGDLIPYAAGCLCPMSPLPPQHTVSIHTGKAACVNSLGLRTNWTSLLIAFPIIPWPHMVSTSIGSWTTGSVYPGKETAWVDEGLFRYYDSCFDQDTFQVFYGATTKDGWTVVPTSSATPLTQTFTDIADNWSAPVSGPHTLPLMGNVLPTDHLIYTNVP